MPITALPSLDRTSATFKTDLDSYFLSALPAFSSEANALQTDVNAKQVTASAAAVTAAADALTASAAATSAAATANATRWVSGTTYALDVCAISPINSQTYRRKVAGAGTTDPSADATNWAKAIDALPVQTGNSGKFLTTNGTAESWGAAPASALTLLAVLTASASAAVAFTGVITSTYDDYLVLFDSVIPSANFSPLLMRVSEDNGSTWRSTSGDYAHSTQIVCFASYQSASTSTTDTSVKLEGGIASNVATDAGVNGSLNLYALTRSSGKKSMVADLNSSTNYRVATVANLTRSNAINAIQFFFTSGTITSGTFRLYGFQKA